MRKHTDWGRGRSGKVVLDMKAAYRSAVITDTGNPHYGTAPTSPCRLMWSGWYEGKRG